MINQPNNNAQLLNGVPANLSGITDGQVVGFDDGELVPVPVQGGTVYVDGTTIQGDGSSGSPLAVVAGVYDSYGAAAAITAAGLGVNSAGRDANISSDGSGNMQANQINVSGQGVSPIVVNNGAAVVDTYGNARFYNVTCNAVSIMSTAVFVLQSDVPSRPIDGQMYYDGTHLYIYIAGNNAWTTII